MSAYYPKSRVEISGFLAKHYDLLTDIMTAGLYPSFIRKAISLVGIKPGDRILDLGAGTGRNCRLMQEYLAGDGEVVGLDISDEMISQFEANCSRFPGTKVMNRRIDLELDYEDYFDKVFISFVLHGFPREARDRIVNNAFKALKRGGGFFILDYNEFSLGRMPLYLRIPFRIVECPYAFEFIETDLEQALARVGFGDFEKHLFFGGYVRLLKGVKAA